MWYCIKILKNWSTCTQSCFHLLFYISSSNDLSHNLINDINVLVLQITEEQADITVEFPFICSAERMKFGNCLQPIGFGNV